MDNGWVKIHRSITKWEWYSDTPTRSVFLHLIFMANHKPAKWRGIEISKGEVLTGRISLAKQLGLTQQQVRTALTKLKSTNEITIKTTNKYSLVKVINYNLYQQVNQQPTTRATNNQPTSNQQLTTNKNDKKEKNDNNEKKERESSLEFKEFWEAYPKRIGRKKAESVFTAVLKKDPSAFEKILTALENQKKWREQTSAKDGFVPEWKHPTTWLNQECWNDEIDTGESSGFSKAVLTRAQTFYQNTGGSATIEKMREWETKLNNGERI